MRNWFKTFIVGEYEVLVSKNYDLQKNEFGIEFLTRLSKYSSAGNIQLYPDELARDLAYRAISHLEASIFVDTALRLYREGDKGKIIS